MSSVPGQIVYFGDSLTDDGNLLAFAEQIVDPAAIQGLGGPTGSASDGPTHATYTADLLGIATQNYAVASAEVVGVQDLAFVAENFGLENDLIVPDDDPILQTDINLAGQVDRFLDNTPGSDLSDTVAMIWIGANDYNEIDFTSDTLIQDFLSTLGGIVDGIAQEAVRLWTAGVGTIQIVTQPAADFYAGSADLSDSDLALGNAVLTTHNFALGQLVDTLQAAGVNAQLFDVTAITDTITEDRTAFGFIAPFGTTLIDDGTLDAFDADQVFSTDDLHPTTAVHGVIGAYNAFALAGGTTTVLTERFDFLRAGVEDDFIAGRGGTDIIRAGDGQDIVIGGTGQDDLVGQLGNDMLNGGSDDDLLRGNLGHDILGGGEGNDTMLGGGGNDLLVDGLGSDVVRGGAGDDIFVFTEATLIGGTTGTDLDYFDGGHGSDQLILALSHDTYSSLAADLTGTTPDAALASLGITAIGIEDILVIQGRDALDTISPLAVFDTANLWGLI